MQEILTSRPDTIDGDGDGRGERVRQLDVAALIATLNRGARRSDVAGSMTICWLDGRDLIELQVDSMAFTAASAGDAWTGEPAPTVPPGVVSSIASQSFRRCPRRLVGWRRPRADRR